MAHILPSLKVRSRWHWETKYTYIRKSIFSLLQLSTFISYFATLLATILQESPTFNWQRGHLLTALGKSKNKTWTVTPSAFKPKLSLTALTAFYFHLKQNAEHATNWPKTSTLSTWTLQQKAASNDPISTTTLIARFTPTALISSAKHALTSQVRPLMLSKSLPGTLSITSVPLNLLSSKHIALNIFQLVCTSAAKHARILYCQGLTALWFV